MGEVSWYCRKKKKKEKRALKIATLEKGVHISLSIYYKVANENNGIRIHSLEPF